MKVKTISIEYSRKFNLGDFNSAAIGCTLWADVTEEDDLDECMKALWEMAKNNVRSQALPLVQKQAAKVEEIFLGLPVEVQKEVTE